MSIHVRILITTHLVLVELKSLKERVVFLLHVPRVNLHCIVLKPVLTVLATSPTEGVGGRLDENLMRLNIYKRAL